MFCECKEDGFCRRYQREMGGRMREVCAGVNVDIGTSAAFREQWAREVEVNKFEGNPKSLLLRTDQAPGDALVMTAAIYSLHKAYPGKYVTAVESQWPEVFAHNPYIVQAQSDFGDLHMHYPAIHKSNERGIHFMQGWCEFLGMALEIDIPLLTNRPHLYFSDPAPPVEDFWLICSGGKTDFTNKLWGYLNYVRVAASLSREVKFIQVGNTLKEHPRINTTNVTYMVGQTTLRELFDLTRRARGVLCGVSLLMHIAAALEKPAIIVAGGREPVQWNAYPKQHYMHTVGALPCRSVLGVVGGACWRSRTVALNDGTVLDKDLCERPVDGTPECMTLIKPSQVAALILNYNR